MSNKLYGLVVCGGNSTRMGSDKSLINYHGAPQRYHVYKMLENICEKVFISCNESQSKGIEQPFEILIDLPQFNNIGPMAALLTAFTTYPECDFLVTGCDYPFITLKELKRFLLSIEEDMTAAAFYNNKDLIYEPLLAWYSQRSENEIQRMFSNGQHSLQHFLKNNKSGKYEPQEPASIRSADTPEDYRIAKEIIDNIKSFK